MSRKMSAYALKRKKRGLSIEAGVLNLSDYTASAEGNPALPTLDAGANALRRVRARWDQTHRWGVDGPGRVELTDAINLYADILQQSSPAQMQSACDLRHEILTGKRRDPRITRETQV